MSKIVFTMDYGYAHCTREALYFRIREFKKHGWGNCASCKQAFKILDKELKKKEKQDVAAAEHAKKKRG